MFQGSNLLYHCNNLSLSSASVNLFPWSQPAFLPVHGAVRCTHSLTTVAVRIPYSQYSVSVVAFEMCVLTLLYLQYSTTRRGGGGGGAAAAGALLLGGMVVAAPGGPGVLSGGGAARRG